MKQSFLIAGAAVLAMAVPAVAAMHGPGPGPGPMADMTRADVQARVKERFAMIDADKDGAITMDEVKAHREAKRAERRDAHFKAMDKNGDGSISRAEFDEGHAGRGDGMKMAMRGGNEEGYHKMGRRGHHMEMRMGGRMFEKADADKNGKVTLTEATNAALAHFDKVDTNKDGTVTGAERMEYMKSMHDQWKAKMSRTGQES